jgi:hypothetical protein
MDKMSDVKRLTIGQHGDGMQVVSATAYDHLAAENARLREELRLTENERRNVYATIARQAGEIERLTAALRKAEAALADIGDSEGAPKSGVLNLKWAEQRAADVLPDIRAALRPVAAGETAITDTARLDWLLTDASRGQALRVQGSEERGWSVMDMADGLVRVGRGANYRQAIDDAMSNHPPQASGEE